MGGGGWWWWLVVMGVRISDIFLSDHRFVAGHCSGNISNFARTFSNVLHSNIINFCS